MNGSPGEANRPHLAPDRAIAHLAAAQHGVVSLRQLHRRGLERAAVARRVAAGRLHRVHRGVYAVGHPGLGPRGRDMAAVLACGPGAALSHRSAAHLWGLRPGPPKPEVTVLRRRIGPPGVRIHRTRLAAPADFTVREGIPVTSVARTLLDLASAVPARDLARAVDRAERLRLFDLGAVTGVLESARGRRGAAALRRVVAEWRPSGTRSELEDRFRELLAASGLCAPRLNALVEGERRRHEVDALWPAHRLAVQLDGFAFHRTRRDRERDASADADLELGGHRVMRLTWDDVNVHGRRTLRRLRGLVGPAPGPASRSRPGG